ncbi:MAG: purine-nucleoside phosphorylase [Pseudomonadota bacterium]
MYDQIKEAADYVLSKLDKQPKLGIILGSGLGNFADMLYDSVVIDYSEIPNFPQKSKVAGHKGNLVIGKVCQNDELPIVAMQGRIHFYEAADMDKVVFPARLFKLMGLEKLVVTNAAGGVNPSFVPGDLMIIKDHINLFGTNPLIGDNDERFGPRFPDQSNVYSKDLRDIAKGVASKLGFDIKEGVYSAFTGPTYETPAEIHFFKTVGIDAAGMSTIPETIVANHCGLKILGISCITNVHPSKTSHEEVIEVSKKVNEKFIKLITKVIPAIS